MIGNAESLDLGDRRVGEEKFLDFTRIDVLAAPNNHVFQSTNNIAVTFLIDSREIARMHESGSVDRSCCRRGIIPIAAHDAVSTGEQLAGDSRGDDSTLRVDNLDFEMRQDASDRGNAPFEWVIIGALKADRARF